MPVFVLQDVAKGMEKSRLASDSEKEGVVMGKESGAMQAAMETSITHP